MRQFLIKATLISALLAVLVISAGAMLSAASPFKPGDTLFPAQYFAEQQRAATIGNQTSHALFLLDLAERRTKDLAARAGTKHELLALQYLNRALDQAMLALSHVPKEDLDVLLTRLNALVQQIDAALAMLTIVPNEHVSAYQTILAKVATL
ncbi:MAG: hypothetical protein GY803_22715, partial [Chloroflexi bacterium]|nr:hypothetical protein [Chloroflexota bacterium]